MLLQLRKIDMFDRILSFIDGYSSLFPEQSLQHELAGTIRSAVHDLQRHSANQITGFNQARAGGIAKRKAQAALRQDLLRIARTARLISKTLPEFASMFQFPREKNRQALIDAGWQFAAKASAHYDVFMRYSMNVSFIDELKTNIENLVAGDERRLRS